MKKYVYLRRTAADVDRQLARGTAEETWLSIEDEHGDLGRIPDELLKRLLHRQLRIADILGRQSFRVPPLVWARILEGVIVKLRRAAVSADDKRKIIELNRLLLRFRATLPRRPRHRPRYARAAEIAIEEAVREFEEKRVHFMRDGLSRNDAIEQAAQELAPCYGLRPSTLVSWWGHPGRRPSVRARRRFVERSRRHRSGK